MIVILKCGSTRIYGGPSRILDSSCCVVCTATDRFFGPSPVHHFKTVPYVTSNDSHLLRRYGYYAESWSPPPMYRQHHGADSISSRSQRRRRFPSCSDIQADDVDDEIALLDFNDSSETSSTCDESLDQSEFRSPLSPLLHDENPPSLASRPSCASYHLADDQFRRSEGLVIANTASLTSIEAPHHHDQGSSHTNLLSDDVKSH